MPMYDTICDTCQHIERDVYEPVQAARVGCPACGAGWMQRAWIGQPPAVIGDEIDWTIKHGLCHADGSPRRFRSRAAWKRAMAEKGIVNRVEHLGRPGSDRSPHTTRWV